MLEEVRSVVGVCVIQVCYHRQGKENQLVSFITIFYN
jgi:hypothetical protein